MIIDTVTFKKDGSFNVYDVDGKRYGVPDKMGNRHRVMIQEWIDAGNVPDPYVGPTDMELWIEKMASSDRDLMIRDLEDLITDNPTFTINEYTQVKYDAKIKLRGKRP